VPKAAKPDILKVAIRNLDQSTFPSACLFWAINSCCDRLAAEELMSLKFARDTPSVMLIGPNGTGKSTLALNLAYRARLSKVIPRANLV
jgi:polynucleotide 5'-kinase involved in rRNA processing